MSSIPRIPVLATALLLAACASQPAPGKTAAVKEPSPICVRSTGTIRTNLPEGRCVIGPGRVYTREELERAGGGFSALEALNRVSPF